MEETTKPPAFPPNYVTIVQLRERWVKEQLRKQKEKEEPEAKFAAEQQNERKQQIIREDKVVNQNGKFGRRKNGKSSDNGGRIVVVDDAMNSDNLEQTVEGLKSEKKKGMGGFKKPNGAIHASSKTENVLATMDYDKKDIRVEVRSKGKGLGRKEEQQIIREEKAVNQNRKFGRRKNGKSSENGGRIVAVDDAMNSDNLEQNVEGLKWEKKKKDRRVFKKQNGAIHASSKTENVLATMDYDKKDIRVEVRSKGKDLVEEDEVPKAIDQKLENLSIRSARKGRQFRAFTSTYRANQISETVEVVGKFGPTSKGRVIRTSINRSAGGTYWRFGGIAGAGLVWVKKGEASNDNAGAIQCSEGYPKRIVSSYVSG